MNFMTMEIKEEGGKIVIDEGTFTLNVDGKNADAIKPYVGKSMIFGFRAEDLVFSEKPQAGKTMPVSIGVIEPLGAETHVYGNTAKHQMIARVEPHITFNVGDTANFAPNMEKVIFFDMDTDQAVNLD
jgi:multiple sugar transport system ATP-binding protein